MYCRFRRRTWSVCQAMRGVVTFFFPHSDQSTYQRGSVAFVSTSTGPAVTGAPQGEAPIALDLHLLRTTFLNDLLLKASALNYHDFDEVGAMEVRLMLCNVGCSSTC